MKDLVKWVFYAASFYEEKGKCSACAVPLIVFWTRGAGIREKFRAEGT